MRTRTACGLVALALLAWLLPLPAAAVSIAKLDSSGPLLKYELNSHEFSTYYNKYPPMPGVDCGCGPLSFHAIVDVGQSIGAHTFTAVLKRDGVIIESGTATLGPFFFANNVEMTFDQTAMVPGTWSIEWNFATQNNEHGSQSIVLVAPAAASPPPYPAAAANYFFCNRNSTNPTLAVYQNGICFYRHIPPGGFIAQNGFYVPGSPIPSCPFGTYDNAHCSLGLIPAGTHIFLYMGHYYYDHFPAPNRCPLPASSDDNTHCLVSPPPGIGVFEYMGGLYFNPSYACNAGTYDGAHCLLGLIPAGTHIFLYMGHYYYDRFPAPNRCPLPASSDDNAHCLVSPPPGIGVFEYMGALYFNLALTCPNSATPDANGCLLGHAPPGATAFALPFPSQHPTDWIWSARFCP